MSRGGVLARVAALGASTQAAVPAVYAWSLTVRPIAFARGANLGAQLAGAAAFLAFVAAPLVDRRAPGWGRRLLLVGGLGGCAGAWAFAPRGVTVGATAATLGAIGWALFAFALAGPVLRRAAPAPGTLEDPDDEPVVPLDRGPRPARGRAGSWIDGLYLAAGLVIAAALGGLAWEAPSPERATLVRVVSVACGVLVLDAAASLAVARHTPRRPLALRPRFRRALPWALALAVVSAAGVALLGAGAL